ncbi:MAG: polysaccharide biosynthesis/export family protein [Pleurocapsa sp.]
MKTKTTLYQLLLQRVKQANRYGAIALSLFFVIASTPVIAEEQTIELQDVNSTESPRANPGELPAELPQLKPRELPPTTPPNATTPSGENIEFATAETDYTLGAGDLIALNIFQVEEYSAQYPVLVDGTISLPLVGRVNVSGLTLKETSEVVSKEYATYLKRPIVTVGLVAPRPLKIGISGEIDNPGTYEVAPTGDNQKFPTVTDLITRAGGITTIADVRNVRVRRNNNGKEVVFNSNLWSLLSEGNIRQDISLRDGDTIFVPTASEINTAELSRLSEASFGLQSNEPIKIAVVGEVYRPGSHTIQPEQIGRDTNNTDRSQSAPPRLTQALASANGIKPLANVREVEVRRTAWDGTEKLIAVDLWKLLQSGDTNQDIILQKGDKIIVPQATSLASDESEAIAAASFNRETITVNVVGEVGTPGAQQVPPNTPLNQAILAAGGFDSQRADSGKVELVRLNPNGTVDKRQIEVDLAAGIDDDQNPILRHNDVVVVARSGVTKASDGLGQVFSPLGGIFSIFRFLF